jgi:hypothetical protein
VSEFFEARVRAESRDWTFDAHQATTGAAQVEALVTLRRQYQELSDAELAALAESWRSDSTSGPYFVFAAAALRGADGDDCVAVDATFVRALFRELGGEAPAALAALLDQWTEQRGYAWSSGQRLIAARPPRVTVLLSRDAGRWAPQSWSALESLGLEAPRYDGTLLRWDGDSGVWFVGVPG